MHKKTFNFQTWKRQTRDDPIYSMSVAVCKNLANGFEKFHDQAQSYFATAWMKRYDALSYLFNKVDYNDGVFVLS